MPIGCLRVNTQEERSHLRLSWPQPMCVCSNPPALPAPCLSSLLFTASAPTLAHPLSPAREGSLRDADQISSLPCLLSSDGDGADRLATKSGLLCGQWGPAWFALALLCPQHLPPPHTHIHLSCHSFLWFQYSRPLPTRGLHLAVLCQELCSPEAPSGLLPFPQTSLRRPSSSSQRPSWNTPSTQQASCPAAHLNQNTPMPSLGPHPTKPSASLGRGLPASPDSKEQQLRHLGLSHGPSHGSDLTVSLVGVEPPLKTGLLAGRGCVCLIHPVSQSPEQCRVRSPHSTRVCRKEDRREPGEVRKGSSEETG